MQYLLTQEELDELKKGRDKHLEEFKKEHNKNVQMFVIEFVDLMGKSNPFESPHKEAQKILPHLLKKYNL